MEKPELSDLRYQRVNDDGTLSKDLELFVEDLEEWAGQEYERGYSQGAAESYDDGFDSGREEGYDDGYDKAKEEVADKLQCLISNL